MRASGMASQRRDPVAAFSWASSSLRGLGYHSVDLGGGVQRRGVDKPDLSGRAGGDIPGRPRGPGPPSRYHPSASLMGGIGKEIRANGLALALPPDKRRPI